MTNQPKDPRPSDSQDELDRTTLEYLLGWLFSQGVDAATCLQEDSKKFSKMMETATNIAMENIQANYLPKTEVEAAIASELKFYAPNSHASRAVKSIAHMLGLHKKGTGV